MENIKVTILGETIEVPKGTRIQEIADRYQDRFASPIMIAKIGTVMKELRYCLRQDTILELLDMSHADGMRVYQRSVSFLMIVAASKVLGDNHQVVICHSIKKNLYCEVENYTPTEEELQKIEAEMHRMVAQDLPLDKESHHLENAIDLTNKHGLYDKAKLYRFRSVSSIKLYKLEDVYDYFYGYMASSTGPLKWFHLVKEADGFVLVEPSSENPTQMREYEPVDNISEVFREYAQIGKLLHINTAGDLNDMLTQNKLTETILLAEALQEKKIANIADMVLNQGNVKLVLIAGPSSSGKTTFAQRLTYQLRLNGITPRLISLDNYFRNRSEVPLDADGKPNFESFEFLNVELFNENMQKLLRGEMIHRPRYNFLTGDAEITTETMQLGEHDIIIAEGIHGLNERLTATIPKDKKFKIFISALTQLNIDNHNRISTSDTRLLRRVVRDYKTRGASVERTVGMWNSVLRGEAEYIFPTQQEADVVFNSSLIYELSVLKQFAEPLLFSVGKDSPLYPECKRLIKFLSCFLGAPTEDIPKNSILREFIGGSCFHV